MNDSNELVGALALGMCALLIACSGSGPSDGQAADAVRAYVFKTKALAVKSVKSSGCAKTKEGELKEPGVFYRCAVELDVPGYVQGKARAYLHEVNGKWEVVGIE